MKTTDKLVYLISEEKSNQYTIDVVKVFAVSVFQTSHSLAGTIDNRDGYNQDAPDKGAAIAAKMGRIFQSMLDAGHDCYFDGLMSDVSFLMKYQRYDETTHCAPSISLPTEYSQAKRAMDILTKIGKAIKKESPRSVGDWSFKDLNKVVQAIHGKLKALPCEKWQVPSHLTNYPQSFYVPEKSK